MTPTRPILFIGNDPSLEYLLKRYATQSSYHLQSVRAASSELDICAMQPASVWFSSMEALEASQQLRTTLINCNIPIVVCSSIADETRAVELGADYHFLHPVTYDCFLSALTETEKK